MPVHRLVLVFTLATLLGLVAVYLQIQRVQLGYRVSQEEARAARLREAVRDAEVRVSRRRDPAALRARAESQGIVLGQPVAGRVMLVTGRRILAVPPAPGPERLAQSSR